MPSLKKYSFLSWESLSFLIFLLSRLASCFLMCLITFWMTCSSLSFLEPPLSFVMRELYLFLIICSVLVWLRTGTNLDHFFPISVTKLKMRRSSWGVQFPCFFFSSKWLSHLSRQCFALLKVSKFEVKKRYLDTSFHFPSSQFSTASVNSASSSGVQKIFPSCFRTFK